MINVIRNSNDNYTIIKNDFELGNIEFPFIFFRTARINLSKEKSNILIKSKGFLFLEYVLIIDKIEKFNISRNFFSFTYVITDLTNFRKYRFEKFNLLGSKHVLLTEDNYNLLTLKTHIGYFKRNYEFKINDEEIDDFLLFICLFFKIKIDNDE